MKKEYATAKDIIERSGYSKQAIHKMIKDIDSINKTIKGSAKPVKHYLIENFPQKYRKYFEKNEDNIVHAPDMSDFYSASAEAQHKALLTIRLCNLYAIRLASQSMNEFLKHLSIEYDELNPTASRIYRWIDKISEAKKAGRSVPVSMLDKRGREKGSKVLTEDMKEMAVRLLTRKNTKMRPKAIHESMCMQYGDAMCSYQTLIRYLNDWKNKNHILHAVAQNPADAKNKYLAAFGSKSEIANAVNTHWELDSTPADVITSDGVRMCVLAAVDVYSRMVVFHLDERSNSYSIARLLRKAILRLGVPDNVILDNGKDYQSNHIESILYNLDIGKITVPPFSGDEKPHVERVFRTLGTNLFEQVEGYIGHSVAERSQIQSKQDFQGQIESRKLWQAQFGKGKDEYSKLFSLKEANKDKEVFTPLSALQLEELIDKWNERIYSVRVHGGIKTTPKKKFESSPIPPKSISDPRMLDILLGKTQLRTVSKKGIHYEGAEYVAVELYEYIGTKVLIMDHEDRGHIFVFSMSYKPICVAEDPEFLGLSRAKYALGKVLSRKLMQESAKLVEKWDAYSKEHDPTIIDIIDAAPIAPIQSVTTKKQTEVILAMEESVRAQVAQDEEKAKESHTMNMKGEKLMPSGRPMFKSMHERIVWELKHNDISEQVKELKEEKSTVYSNAYDEYERWKKQEGA